MTTLSKRWISSFTILAFLTTSLVPLAPVYAGRHPHKHNTIHSKHHSEEPSVAKPARAHRLSVEEVLQEPVQTTTPSSQGWLPDWLPEFVQNPLSTVVELVSSLLGVNVEKTTIDEAVASLAALPREAAHQVVKGVKYAVKHPGEALVLFLSAQVAAASAFRDSQTQEGPMDSLLSEHNKRLFPIGNNFQINQDTVGNANPSIATLSNGNVFVVWDNGDVYGRIFAPNGTALSNEFQINQVTTGYPEHPSIAALSNANAFVVWDNGDVYGRIFALNGTALSNEFSINQVTSGNQQRPSIAILSNGNAFVVWYGNPTGNIDGRLFAPNGTALGDEFLINTGENPSIAALSNGNAFVVWGSDSNNVFGGVFVSNGTALGNEFQINQITTGNQYNPKIATLSNANAFVVWDNGDVYGRIFALNGTALSNEFQINQNTINNEFPSIATLSNGNVFIVWDDGNVYGRIFAPNGTALGNEFGINQITGNQYISAIAALSNGNAFVVWSGGQTGNININIYGQIFDTSVPVTTTGSSITTELQTSSMTTTGSQTFPPTASMKIPTTSSNDILPVLLGVGGATAATCLGVSLLGGCAVAGVYAAKKYKKHQDKLAAYGNTKTVNQELLQDSPYAKAISVKENAAYGNTETVNQELLKKVDSPYSKAIPVKGDERSQESPYAEAIKK